MKITQILEKIKLRFPSRIFSLIFMLFILFSISACERQLMEDPKSVAAETFFNTAAEVETGVNAIYSPLRNNNFANYTATLEIQTDYAFGRGSWAPIHGFQGLNDANITRVSGFWYAFYVSIRNANIVIKNAPNGKAISQGDIDKYLAEAKFLRAFNYFQLVRAWGGVPIRTEKNMTELNLKRNTVEEIYSLILSDLETAEANLPDNPKNMGRPTKWAAKALLSDVYLTLKRYNDAMTKADEIIKSNKYKLVDVSSVSDFQNKVYGPTLVSTTEEIFYLKYTRRQSEGNYMLWITNHPTTKLFNFGGAYVIYMSSTSPYYTNWNNGDLRKSLWAKVNIGLGVNTVISSKFIDTEASGDSGAGNDDPVYGYSDVLLIYAEAANKVANGPTTEAMEALNKVHRRAYGKNPLIPSTIDYVINNYDEDTFQNLLLKENSYEFHIGGKRWYDLVRTGKAAEQVLAEKNIIIAQKHYLWPIPVSETSYNDAIDPVTDQNPGY